MIKSIIIRLLAIPIVLMAVALMILFLQKVLPNPVEDRLEQISYQSGGIDSPQEIELMVKEEIFRNNWHLPIFYFSIRPGNLPDWYEQVWQPQHKAFLEKLLFRIRNTEILKDFYADLIQLRQSNWPLVERLFLAESTEEIDQLINQYDAFGDVSDTWKQAEIVTFNAAFLIPKFQFHSENQFHSWLMAIIRGELGRSLRDNQPVSSRLFGSLKYTLWLTIPGTLLTWMLSLALGIFIHSRNSGRFASGILRILYVVDAIPLFLIALAILFVFAPFFPPIYLGWSQSSFWQAIPYLILPVGSMVLAALPYTTRQIHSALRSVEHKEFIIAARLKGLPEKKIYTTYLLPNAAFPLITLFTEFLVAIFSGAVLVELIFAIPGIGRLLADAALSGDIPIISGVILLLVLVKMSATLLGDILYVLLNPSVNEI